MHIQKIIFIIKKTNVSHEKNINICGCKYWKKPFKII
jgi:hypothetical protein